MLFLARFILKGSSQAALVAAAMAMLGLIPLLGWFAVLISGATIALVVLVNGHRQGMLVMAYATAGAMVFAALIFTMPLVALYFALLVWLPVWMAATALKQTVSLAMSLQLVAALSLTVVLAMALFAADLGEIWREPLDLMVQQLAEQYQGQLSLEQLTQAEELVIRLLPGLFAGSVMFGTMLSLLLARWWQAVLYNPGGFAEEFQRLNLGKVMALIATGIVLATVLFKTVVLASMLLVISALYLVQGMSVLHAVFTRKQLNVVWLYLVYMLMFFIPHLVVLLVVMGLVDAWIDFRRRIAPDKP